MAITMVIAEPNTELTPLMPHIQGTYFSICLSQDTNTVRKTVAKRMSAAETMVAFFIKPIFHRH